MQTTIFLISALYGFTAMLLILLLFSFPKQSRLEKDSTPDKADWLYSNFLSKLYDALLGTRPPESILKALGLKYDSYMVDCEILGRTPNLKREAMLRILGIFALVFGVILSVPFSSPIPMLLSAVVYLLCASYIPRKVHSDALAKKAAVSAELSRFVDLLLSALEINLPVEIAIAETADSVPGILSAELRRTFAEAHVGAMNWQQALEKIAHKYEIDQLSDFVSDIITAYNKGISVTEAVARKSYEIKQSVLLQAKERTAKMSNSILVPVTIFKIIPLMAVMMIPIISQIFNMFLF